jgi:hypothetical protein
LKSQYAVLENALDYSSHVAQALNGPRVFYCYLL